VQRHLILSGAAQTFGPVGKTLSVSNGSWSGTQPMTFTYQWVDCELGHEPRCTNIEGASNRSYTARESDVGHGLRAVVTAANQAGETSAGSQITDEVTATGGGEGPTSGWSVQPIDAGTPTAVSCASPSFCAAVASKGDALTYNGSSWSVPAQVDGEGGQLESVSCASSVFCVAVGLNQLALTYNGSAWSAPAEVHEGGVLTSVSCASSSFCVAVNLSGDALIYNGGAWSAPAAIDGGGGLSSVSCASPSFCVAVGGNGSGGVALTYDGST
jgi:hypothetical protein